MKRYLIISLAIITLIGITFTGCGSSGKVDFDPDFEGNYKLKSMYYNADIDITETGDNYHLTWTIADGTIVHGKGIEIDGVLGYCCAEQGGMNPGGGFFVKVDDKLYGMWTPVGGGELIVEKTPGAKKIKPSPIDMEGSYKIEGRNAYGETYDMILRLKKAEDDTYVATWTGTDAQDEGEGMVVNNVLILSFGDNMGQGLAVYEIKDDEGSEIEGKWLYIENTVLADVSPVPLGTEKGTKK